MIAIKAGQEEMLRFNYVKEIITADVRRLHASDEYQRACGDVFNAAIDFGWLDGVREGRTEQQVNEILASHGDFDMEAVEGFTAAYDAMFVRSYSYVEKIKSSYYLPLADLMNILSHGIGATPGAESSGS